MGGWFLSYTSHVKGGQDMEGQHDTLGGRGWIPASHTTILFPNKFPNNYFVTGEEK
jgi:hypothetical protein